MSKGLSETEAPHTQYSLGAQDHNLYEVLGRVSEEGAISKLKSVTSHRLPVFRTRISNEDCRAVFPCRDVALESFFRRPYALHGMHFVRN